MRYEKGRGEVWRERVGERWGAGEVRAEECRLLIDKGSKGGRVGKRVGGGRRKAAVKKNNVVQQGKRV